MANLQFTNIGIRGIGAAVPKKVINNYDYTANFPKEDVKKIVDKIGVYERRFVDDTTCASDLCFAEAEKLLFDLQIGRNEIDVLIFVSQTADYRMPATSIILQNKLGLGKHVMAFDINLGCSGFVYGLSVAFSIMQQPGFKKALLLDGETRSKIYSPLDRKTAFLFGDGGIAALIDKDEKYGNSFFVLGSDGSKENLIKMDAGGYRNQSTPETQKNKVVDEHGNIRSDEHG
jgi:3-oxoacyl-[acyl-carrier-protein] synthase-3